MLALVFIRKLLDICFSKRELSYLDDPMPENKKKLNDDSKSAEEVCDPHAEFNKSKRIPIINVVTSIHVKGLT